MTRLGQEDFTREAWTLVGWKVSKARRINDIYETACGSVALPVDEDSVSITMFRMVIAQARSLIRQRDEIERTADAMLSENRDYQLLRMIPGIGPINVRALGPDFESACVERVQKLRSFATGNDPYGEHDFGAFKVNRRKCFWKIDYYDAELEWGSEDPADPSRTARVLAILLAEEY